MLVFFINNLKVENNKSKKGFHLKKHIFYRLLNNVILYFLQFIRVRLQFGKLKFCI
jgi:hypothetical protein